MATAEVAVVSTAWTLVAAESTNVFISPKSAFSITFQVQTTLPAANNTVGHKIPQEGLSLALGAGENVYAKTYDYDGKVVVTTFV